MPRRCELGCRPLTGPGVPIHMFPNPEKFPETFKAWVEIVGGTLKSPDHYTYYKRRMICDIHFTDRDKNRNHRLKALAVPTLYLPDAKKDSEATQDDAGGDSSCDSETLEEGPESNLICGQRDASSGREEQYATPPQSLRAEIRAPKDDARARYLCNSCGQHITGCRYVCVQCVDWDLCGECEAAGAHPAHFVLRVPEGKQKDAVEAFLRTIRRAVTDWFVLINEEEMVEEDPKAVDFGDGFKGWGDPQMEAPGEPRDKNPTAAKPVPDVDLYMDANASIEETGSAEPNQNKPSNLIVELVTTRRVTRSAGRKRPVTENVPGMTSPAQKKDKRPNKTVTHTQKLQLQDTYKKSSDTKVVPLPVVRVSRGNRSGASLVSSHGRDVTKLALTSSDVDVETSRAVVPVPARRVTRSAGRKRRVTEKVPEMTSPAQKKVAIISLQRLTEEQIQAAISKK